MKKMYIAKGGCPICRSDVVGNPKILYLCRKCMVLYPEKVVLTGNLFDGIEQDYL